MKNFSLMAHLPLTKINSNIQKILICQNFLEEPYLTYSYLPKTKIGDRSTESNGK